MNYFKKYNVILDMVQTDSCVFATTVTRLRCFVYYNYIDFQMIGCFHE